MEKDCPKDCHKKAPFIFRKVVIPASIDDDSKNPPKNGAYHNVIVVYEATGNAYIYSSDGIPTRVSADAGDIDAKIAKAVGDEAELREVADQEIWTEIETIEAGSDVVDVVGTYAELQQYGTSTLQNGDIIKVLADETRSGAITYYRWDATTQAFTYVGSEGPYYTSSEVDTLLAGKQGTLTAGANITIATDNTISATDTTYTHFTGATASTDGVQGLVPGPLAGDQNKFLKGDGTWGDGAANTVFYMNASETGATRHLYKASDMTGLVTMQDIINANEEGQVIVRISTSVDPSTYSDMYLQNAYVATGDYQMIFLDNQYYYSFDTSLTSDNTFQFAKSEVQRKLTAGTNVQINGNTISATDTTYSDFVGTDGSVAGVHGLVPAPATTDANKYLKSDGTWATVQGGGGATVTDFWYYNDDVYSDSAHTTAVVFADVDAAFANGGAIIHGIGDNARSDALLISSDPDRKQFKLINPFESTDEKFQTLKNVSTQYANWSLSTKTMQKKLTAGTNISINQSTNTISVTGMPVLYGSQGQNTDGAVTQKVFTDTVGDVESILQILNSGSGV